VSADPFVDALRALAGQPVIAESPPGRRPSDDEVDEGWEYPGATRGDRAAAIRRLLALADLDELEQAEHDLRVLGVRVSELFFLADAG
jgi:hypothetical protein